MRVLTTVDYLKGKIKKNYINGGIVKMYNMYDDIKNIPSYDDIYNMEYESGRMILEEIRKRHSAKSLAKHFKVSNYRLYNHLFVKFNIKSRSYNYDSKSKSSKARKTNVVAIENTLQASDVLEQQRNDIVQATMVVKKGVEAILSRLSDNEQSGLFQRIKGIYSGKEVSDRILSSASQLSEFKKYEIFVQISEREDV